jgi:hypothetical protein
MPSLSSPIEAALDTLRAITLRALRGEPQPPGSRERARLALIVAEPDPLPPLPWSPN